VRSTHVAEDDGRHDGIVVTHADVALELAVLLPEGLCASVKLGLAERRHGGIADGGGGDANGGRHGSRQEGIERIVTEFGEHEGGLVVIRTNMPVGESVERVKEGDGCFGGRKTSGVEPRALVDSGEGESKGSRGAQQGWHGAMVRMTGRKGKNRAGGEI